MALRASSFRVALKLQQYEERLVGVGFDMSGSS